MARTSTSERSSQAPMRSWRARIEFTFHVAILTLPPYAVGPRGESAARIAPAPLRARPSCVRPDPPQLRANPAPGHMGGVDRLVPCLTLPTTTSATTVEPTPT